MGGLVSIVLPIYNVENYLESCIKSIVNQSYRQLEIILVDDGSKDGCPIICDQWGEKDKRIKVIHQENRGLGFARNVGIENASGKYIFFIDSDDYLALDTVEKCLAVAEKDNSDIVIYGYCRVKNNVKTGEYCVPRTAKNVYLGAEVQAVFLPNLIAPNLETGEKTNLWMSAWSCMYAMRPIRESGWRFVSESRIISEDVYSLLSLYRTVQTVSVLSEPFYFYRENDTSLTHTYRSDRYEKIKHFYDRCQELCDEIGYNETIKKQLAYPYISNTIAALKMIVNADLPRREKREVFKRVVFDEHLQSVLKKTNLQKESFFRKILLLCLKNKYYRIAYFLIQRKSRV